MLTKVAGVWKRSKLNVNVAGDNRPCSLGHVNVDGEWRLFYDGDTHPEEYVIQVAVFDAPNEWAGFHSSPGREAGTISVEQQQGADIRDMNAAQVDIRGPLFFQFGIFYTSPLPKAIKYVSVGEHERLPYVVGQLDQAGDVVRYFFSDGVTDIYQYLKSLEGQDVLIKLWVEN